MSTFWIVVLIAIGILALSVLVFLVGVGVGTQITMRRVTRVVEAGKTLQDLLDLEGIGTK